MDEKQFQLKGEDIEKNRLVISKLEISILEKRNQFEESIKSEILKLQELKRWQDEFEIELIVEMSKNNINSFKTEKSNIIHSKRVGIKIQNEIELTDYIVSNAAKLKEYVKDIFKTKDELIDKILPRKVSATSVKLLSDRYEAVTGLTLPGMNKNETNYLTIKSINV